ncbi:MAG: alpha-2-macroglobulin [Bacteroidota bacterium]
MLRITLFTLVFAFFFSCGDKKPGTIVAVKDDFSSPKNLFVDHITSFTGGVVSIASDVKLRLTSGVPDSLVGTAIEDFFTFSPSINGLASWEDNRTIVFRPESYLAGNQKYEVTADLKKVIPEIDSDKRNFKFIFQTLIQNFEVKVDGLKLYNPTDPSDVKIEGTLQTADVVDIENLRGSISASQSGKNLEITILDTNQDNLYEFNIEHVVRADQEGEVSLTVDGSPIKVDRKEQLDVKIPALGDYKVLSSRIVRGEENYISVLFSDVLDRRQNLSGLVALSNSNNQPRTVVDLNELKIYPTSQMEGAATLKINSAIRNISGGKLKEDYSVSLQFTQIKPEVRLVDADKKAILPNSNGLILPFEAVGLKAVDITIVKVFEDNMLQYLQVNGIGGTGQLNRVARPIARKTVPLNTSGVTNLNAWNQFTLNLEDLLSAESGSIYQVKIGFQKRHSLYFCSDSDNIESIDTEIEEWGPEDEDSYWDSYDYYYNPNYNWEERDNPCSDSYYGSRRSVNKMLMASDMGLVAKKRDGGDLHIFLTNLISTQPISDANVEVYDYQQQKIAEGKTNGDGKLKLAVDGKPFALIARKGDQVGYLKLDDGSSLSLSNFDVTGTKIQKGLKGFIYGERGVWRPADTVHLGFILEDIENALPDDHPVVMELYDPNQKLTYRKISSQGVEGMFRFDFVTPSDAPTGNWRAEAKVGGASFSKTVKIETIKPNRLKINLEFDKDKFSAADKNISGDLNVRWLSGAKAGNLKAEFELLLRPAKTTFDGFPNFSFDDNSKDFYSEREMVYQARLNSEGNSSINITLGKNDKAPGALNAMLFGKVYEEGGDFSINNTTIPYYPYSSFVGIKAPEGDKRGILLTDQDHTIQIASVDADGTPVSRSNLKVSLYKLNWKWWWDSSSDYLSNYVGRSYHDPVLTGKVSTANGVGSWKLRVNQPQWGRYYLVVEDPTSGHSAGTVIYMDWPGWAGKGKRGELGGATMLDFAVEKEEYKVGENIALSIPSTPNNKILVSLESGSEVLQTFWVDTKAENTTVSFEATSDMAPNIYAHLTMIQPHSQTANDLPIRLYGVKSIKVVDPQTVLEPTISMPSELRPEQEYTIEIGEKSEKAMAYTIAIVDEGLLDITNFKSPDPWGSFYSREALGIKTWDVYEDVMGAFAGKMQHLLAIGGDGEIQPKEENEANRFKPVVHFLGPFFLKRGEVRKHEIKMPQYIGSVKTMVVAASNGAYGKAENVTSVKQPLMVLATLPRVTGPGESMKLPVNVFTMNNSIKNVSVTVEASGVLSLAGQKTATLQFSESGDKVIYFDIKAKQAIGVGKVKVIAKSGNLEATYDIEMNVIPRNPVTTDVADKVISGNSNWDLVYSPIGMLGENQASIEVSSLPPLNLQQRLQFLIRYPHGCIEQTTSSVFPQLFLSKLTSVSEERAREIQKNVDAGISRLKSFQTGSGGFTYWPGGDYPNNWGSNYAGHFLMEAKNAGYAVPEGMISSWIAYQTQKANNWGPSSTNDDNDLIQSYRLYTLALAGSPSLSAMNRMRESTAVRRSAKWRLAIAYAVAGYNTQAEELIAGLPMAADSTLRDYRYSFGSATRDRAMILETLIALGKNEDAFELLMNIAGEMGDKDRWMSTQTTAYCLIAISKYAASYKIDEATSVTISEDGNSSDLTGTEFIFQKMLGDPDKQINLKLTNKGSSPVFARLIRTGIPIEGTEAAIQRNIQFDIDYRDTDGNPVNVSSLKQGTNFRAKVTVVNPGTKGEYNELALTQIFPSGWEIINTRLDGSESSNQGADYIDIRDDRTMHYFDLKPNQKLTFDVLLNASYQGEYYLPSVSVEAMYDNSIFANKPGKWVKVIPE